MTIGCNARESTKMMKMPIVPFAASPAMAQNLQRSGATQLLVMRRSKPTISDPFRTNSTWEDPTESQHERWHGKSFLTPTASWRIKLDMDDIDMCIQIHIFSVYVTPSPRKSVDEIRHKMKFWNDMMTYLVATMAPSSSPKKTGMQHYSTEPSCCPKSPVRAWDFAPNLLRTWMVDWNDSRICLSKLMCISLVSKTNPMQWLRLEPLPVLPFLIQSRRFGPLPFSAATLWKDWVSEKFFCRCTSLKGRHYYPLQSMQPVFAKKDWKAIPQTVKVESEQIKLNRILKPPCDPNGRDILPLAAEWWGVNHVNDSKKSLTWKSNKNFTLLLWNWKYIINNLPFRVPSFQVLRVSRWKNSGIAQGFMTWENV